MASQQRPCSKPLKPSPVLEVSAGEAVAAKAPRKQLAASNQSSPGSSDRYSGGNPVRWTRTPVWQKGIGNFFQKCDASNGENSCEANHDTTSSTESSTPPEVISSKPNNDTTSSSPESKTGSEPSSEIILLE